MQCIKKWWQIEIKDPYGLAGKSLVELLETINNERKLRYVLVDNADGAIDQELRKDLPKIFSYKEFIEKAIYAVQFDFGDFYLFHEKKEAVILKGQINKNSSSSYYDYSNSELLINVSIIVSAFDDELFIIYTPNKYYVDRIKLNYKQLMIKKKNRENLEFY